MKSTRISKNTEVQIRAVHDEADLDEPVWAINWFDITKPKLYGLYNKLAYSHLIKVGGALHFKGFQKEKLEGNQDFDRQMLLIVKYPSASHFLKMASSKLFLLKSILRTKSVKKYIFGFTKRMDNGANPSAKLQLFKERKYYLVYHFQGNSRLNGELPKTQEVKLFFNGSKAATIGRKDTGKELKEQPFFIDGIALWESDNKEQLLDFTKTPEFLNFKSQQEENNLYFFKRII